MVHLDVKPSNVLIGCTGHRDSSANGASDLASSTSTHPMTSIVVKLVDFGIAQDTPRRTDSGLDGDLGAEADASEPIGTPAYMAPEQLLGQAVDHRADQFALGIVLYQMLAGVRPFDGDDGRPAIQRVRRDPPKAFRVLGLTIPRALERIALRCLAKRPADRFNSTQEIADELARFLDERVDSVADLSALHRRALSRAGVLDERRSLRTERAERTDRAAHDHDAPAQVARIVRQAPMRVRAVPFTPTVFGIALASLFLMVGGAVIHLRLGGIRSGSGLPEQAKTIAADPTEVGYLRLNVRPWAEVFIDGARIDITPIARPLRVRSGRHLLTLIHPQKTEKRVVEVPLGQTVALDVVLDVPMPNYADEFLLPEAAPSASALPATASRGSPFGVSSTLQQTQANPQANPQPQR
ncbi:MAG: hypothetical protein NVSMB1_15910 [Polyangiales bacterium]